MITGTLRPEPQGAGFYFTLCTGGHQPGLFIDPGGDSSTAQPVRPTTGMIVGAIHDASFSTCCLHLRPGQTLLLFTDGIIEARRAKTPSTSTASPPSSTNERT
ncbi:SpoIIE family protein phosphatase [Mycobacterium sp. PSTR-4-N]|uniref:SpoIIE family protein phosphatase n=1 Tax=Mycobacterium sp. PSTR-4-N TaxID=2917745 RepID=UPI0035B0CCE3